MITKDFQLWKNLIDVKVAGSFQKIDSMRLEIDICDGHVSICDHPAWQSSSCQILFSIDPDWIILDQSQLLTYKFDIQTRGKWETVAYGNLYYLRS